MKKLYLIRHAKSDWSEVGQSDFDRGINQRGEKSIKIMRDFLRERGVSPDLVVSSRACRAKLTTEGMVEKLNYKKKDIVYLDDIYDTHTQGYEPVLPCIMKQSNDVESMFLVGHNHAITELAEYLYGKSIGNMPTCSIICLKFSLNSRKEISYGNGEIVFFESPKTLTDI